MGWSCFSASGCCVSAESTRGRAGQPGLRGPGEAGGPGGRAPGSRYVAVDMGGEGAPRPGGGGKDSSGRSEPRLGDSGGSGARAPGGVAPAPLAGGCPPSFPLSLLPPPLRRRTSRSRRHFSTGVHILSPAHLVFQSPRGRCGEGAPRAARRPERLPGGSGLRAGWREVGSRRANSGHPLRAPRGRVPGTRGPCLRRRQSLRGAGEGPRARLPAPNPPPLRPLQPPASAARGPASWPLPRRA